MLVFKTSEDYETVVTTQGIDERNIFLTDVRNMNFVSYTETITTQPNNDVVKDDFVAQILNQDFIVQIGSFLYKINTITSKVYVLPVANINQYVDIVNENMGNINIKRYSTNDNVIELVENGNLGGKLAALCTENGAGARSDAEQTTLATKFELCHKSFGIYFDIFVNANSVASNAYINYVFDTDPLFRRDKIRCGNTTTAPSTWSTLPQTNAKYKIDQSIKNFSRYCIRAKGEYYNKPNGSSSYVYQFSSRVLEIRVIW